MTITAAGVVSQIRRAFESVPYPGDQGLVLEISNYDPEIRDVEAGFRGKRWQDITVEFLEKYDNALPLLSTAGYRYYFPAYMIGCVEAPFDVNIVPDALVTMLTPPKNRAGSRWDFFWTRSSQFSPAERAAILMFLKYQQEWELNDKRDMPKDLVQDRVAPAIEFWQGLQDETQRPGQESNE